MEKMPATVESPVVAAESRSPRLVRMEECRKRCNAAESAFAEAWAQYGNKAKAYRVAMNYPAKGPRNQQQYNSAVEYSYRPQVYEYFEALKALAAENAAVNVQRLLERDMRVVAADDANGYAELIRYVWLNCRHCWGVGGAYQWIDEAEYQATLMSWFDSQADGSTNAIMMKPATKPQPMPTTDGGFGFNSWNEPNESCRQCKGLGQQQTVVADTTTLEGAAAVLYRGIKQTNNGIEVLTQDVEKARDRLYKAAGVFKDDAASIAKGAAAGAALGAAAGSQLANRAAVVAESMSDEQAARMYLELAG